MKVSMFRVYHTLTFETYMKLLDLDAMSISKIIYILY